MIWILEINKKIIDEEIPLPHEESCKENDTMMVDFDPEEKSKLSLHGADFD